MAEIEPYRVTELETNVKLNQFNPDNSEEFSMVMDMTMLIYIMVLAE